MTRSAGAERSPVVTKIVPVASTMIREPKWFFVAAGGSCTKISVTSVTSERSSLSRPLAAAVAERPPSSGLA